MYEIWIEDIETISDTRTTRVHMGSAELAIYSEASRKFRMIMDRWYCFVWLMAHVVKFFAI